MCLSGTTLIRSKSSWCFVSCTLSRRYCLRSNTFYNIVIAKFSLISIVYHYSYVFIIGLKYLSQVLDDLGIFDLTEITQFKNNFEAVWLVGLTRDTLFLIFSQQLIGMQQYINEAIINAGINNITPPIIPNVYPGDIFDLL